MDFERIVATERRLREPLCSVECTNAYCVYRSDMFPHFYGANCIEITCNEGRILRDWEYVFEQHFPTDVYRHKTFVYQKNIVPETLAEEAQQAGYDVVQVDAWMYTRKPLLSTPLPSGLCFGRVETTGDWNQYRAFYHEVNKGERWYTPSGCDSLFNKTTYVSDAIGITWLYLAEGDVFVAVIGVFFHNGIARLQDVETHPLWRRRGLATHLLYRVCSYALHTHGADAVVLCADVDYVAIDLYKKMGFVAAGETVELMKFP